MAHIRTTTASTSLAGPSVTSVSGLRSAQLAFAHCMRSHGVPAYPDPGSEGGLAASKEGASGQLDVNSSQFRDGLGHCRRLLPTGARPLLSSRRLLRPAPSNLPGVCVHTACLAFPTLAFHPGAANCRGRAILSRRKAVRSARTTRNSLRLRSLAGR